MKHVIEMRWKEHMAFESEVNGHRLIVDADESVGGKNLGPRPKLLMLNALAGCTGMDVVSILKKMKVEFSYFNVVVEAELTNEHPKYYHTFKIIYQFKGVDLPLEKIKRAVSLSEEKYCGVSALYRKGAEISSEIQILS